MFMHISLDTNMIYIHTYLIMYIITHTCYSFLELMPHVCEHVLYLYLLVLLLNLLYYYLPVLLYLSVLTYVSFHIYLAIDTCTLIAYVTLILNIYCIMGMKEMNGKIKYIL